MRGLGAAAALALAAALAACSPGATRKGPEPEAARPTEIAQQTFAHCTWGEVKGATLSMWSYTCGPDAGAVRVVADDVLPGFVLESTDPARPEHRVVVRLFDKAADAPIDSVLDAVRALSPGLNTPTCAFTPLEGVDHAGKGHVEFAPTGAAKVAYDAAVSGETMPGEPCGPLGVGPVGDRYFAVVPGRPDKVMFVDRGSEIQIFDETTLKVSGR